MKNNTLSYRMEQVEKRVNSLDSKIDKLLTNDLPHLREDIIRLRTQVKTTAVINVGAIILGLILSNMI